MQGDVGPNENGNRALEKDMLRKNEQDLVTEGKKTSVNLFISTSSKKVGGGDNRKGWRVTLVRTQHTVGTQMFSQALVARLNQDP